MAWKLWQANEIQLKLYLLVKVKPFQRCKDKLCNIPTHLFLSLCYNRDMTSRPLNDENKCFSDSGCTMGLLPDTWNCGLRMRQECRERFPRHRLQRKPLLSDLSMHHGMCITHVLWCMSGTLTRVGGKNIPGACAIRNIAYLARGPWQRASLRPDQNGWNFAVISIFLKDKSSLLWFRFLWCL